MKFYIVSIAIILTLCLFITSHSARAAAPVSHVVVALKLLENGKLNVKKEDVPAFLRGTSFNDIRYLGVIDRTKTHTKGITWEMVQEEQDPFKKGMYLHSLLDLAREQYMETHGVYNFVPKPAYNYRGQIVKFIEDQLVYDFNPDWSTVQKAFDTIDAREQGFGIADNDIQKWHDILSNYFSKKPTSSEIVTLMEKLKGSNEQYKKLIPVMDVLAKNEKFQKIILDFYTDVDTHLENYGK